VKRINSAVPRRWSWLCGVIALAATGCVGTVGAEGGVVYGYPTVYAEVAPADLTIYPRVYYRGAYAYLVDGAWYYPSAGGWVVFRQEPVELYRYRTRYLPADRYHGPYRGYGYPQERPRTYERERPRPYTPSRPYERPRSYERERPRP
jgi:hypothetical protein